MKTSSLPQSDLIVKEANDRHVRDLFKVMLVLQCGGGVMNYGEGEGEVSIVDDKAADKSLDKGVYKDLHNVHGPGVGGEKSELGTEMSDHRGVAALGLGKVSSTDMERMACILDESKNTERNHLYQIVQASNQNHMVAGMALAGGGVDQGQGLGPGLGLGQDSSVSLAPISSTPPSLSASLTAPDWSTLTIDLTTDLSAFEKHTRSLLQTAREERLHQLAVAFANNEQQQQQGKGEGGLSQGEGGRGGKGVLSSWDAFDVSQLRRSHSGALVYTGRDTSNVPSHNTPSHCAPSCNTPSRNTLSHYILFHNTSSYPLVIHHQPSSPPTLVTTNHLRCSHGGLQAVLGTNGPVP